MTSVLRDPNYAEALALREVDVAVADLVIKLRRTLPPNPN